MRTQCTGPDGGEGGTRLTVSLFVMVCGHGPDITTFAIRRSPNYSELAG